MGERKQSVNRFRRSGRVQRKQGPTGRDLCIVCEERECLGRRKTFCSKECEERWRMLTSANFVREKVFERDNAICALCGVDCLGAENLYRCGPDWLRKAEDGLAIARSWVDKRRRRALNTGHLWQADHIIPVVEGGGECDLDNYRTLCTACHKAETAKLRKRMARARRKLPLFEMGDSAPQQEPGDAGAGG